MKRFLMAPHETLALSVQLVYLINPDGSLTGPIWMHHQKDGLATPDIPLFKQFKESIDAASKVQTSKTPTSTPPIP